MFCFKKKLYEYLSLGSTEGGSTESGNQNRTKRHCEVCNEDIIGGDAVWNKHLRMIRHVKAAAASLGESCPGFPCGKCGKKFIR